MSPTKNPGTDLTVAHFTDPEGHLIGLAGPCSRRATALRLVVSQLMRGEEQAQSSPLPVGGPPGTEPLAATTQ